MNPKVKAKWVEALRSNTYKQTKFHLKVNDSFCCLGVLCDLHAKETGAEWVRGLEDEKGPSYTYEGEYGGLPKIVLDWAGLVDCTVNLGKGGTTSFASINDNWDYSFNQIANIIEEHF